MSKADPFAIAESVMGCDDHKQSSTPAPFT
jgi:hypothetical protein